MDANFDSITEKAKEVFDALSKKTDELVSSSKARIRRANLGGELKDAYVRLGTATYDAKESGQDNNELCQLIIGEITDLKAEMDRLDREIDTADNVNRCLECAKTNVLEAKYCQNCGAQMPTPPPVEEPTPEADLYDESVTSSGDETPKEDPPTGEL